MAKILLDKWMMENSWVNFIVKVGVPGVIAIYLVWFLTNSVNTNLVKLNSVLEAHATTTTANITAINQNIQENRRIYYMLRTICVNQAKTRDERNECLK